MLVDSRLWNLRQSCLKFGGFWPALSPLRVDQQPRALEAGVWRPSCGQDSSYLAAHALRLWRHTGRAPDGLQSQLGAAGAIPTAPGHLGPPFTPPPAQPRGLLAPWQCHRLLHLAQGDSFFSCPVATSGTYPTPDNRPQRDPGVGSTWQPHKLSPPGSPRGRSAGPHKTQKEGVR